MNEFNVIVVMNEAMLKLLKSKNANHEENLKIKKYLEDESIFFKLKKTNALNILQKVGVKLEMQEVVYKKLISQEVFYDLLNKGKIKADDDNLIIKYDTYSSNDVFKKRKKES